MKIKKFNSFLNESKHNIDGKEISCAYDLSEAQVENIKFQLENGQFQIKNGKLYGTGGCVWLDSHSFKLWQGDDKFEVEKDVQKRFKEKNIRVEPIYVK